MGYAKLLNLGPSHNPINIKLQNTLILCYKILGKIDDCVRPASKILFHGNKFFEILCYGKDKN